MRDYRGWVSVQKIREYDEFMPRNRISVGYDFFKSLWLSSLYVKFKLLTQITFYLPDYNQNPFYKASDV